MDDPRSPEQKKIDEQQSKVRSIILASLSPVAAVLVAAAASIGRPYYFGVINKEEAQALAGLFLITAPAVVAGAFFSGLHMQRNAIKRLMEEREKEKQDREKED